MIYRLYLLRHAKAEAGNLHLQDIDRPLAAKGLEDAARLGTWLEAPDYTVCSSALRTRQTYQQLALAGQEAVDFRSDLYHGSPERMLGTLQLSPPQARSVLMVGHNPGVHQLASALASRGSDPLRQSVMLDYRPCTCAVFEFDCASWQEAGPENSRIVDLWIA